MRAGWILATALLSVPALAADCPQPKSLTCEQLLSKAEQRHCFPKTATATPCVAVPCAGVPCIPVDCKSVPCVPTERVVEKTVLVETTKDTGSWLAGGGAVYQAGWGFQAAVGYEWSNGWQLVVGPSYVPHNGKSGQVTAFFGDHDDDDLGTVPYTAPAPSPWGASALLLYRFK